VIFRVRLFAILRECAGAEVIEVELDEGASVGDALAAIGARGDRLGQAIRSLRPVMAVNLEYADAATTLHAGDELALIPPVSGGAADAPHARVHEAPLSLEQISALVPTDGTGAIVTFQGTTRSVERLDYEAYMPMAEERIRAILVDVIAKHEVEGAAAEHRVGPVPLREPSVVIAVAAAHRGPAFAAAREALDRIKAEAPIWKREIEGDTGEWVEGTLPPLDR
jgi:MoaE-MoaD fusion protein